MGITDHRINNPDPFMDMGLLSIYSGTFHLPRNLDCPWRETL